MDLVWSDVSSYLPGLGILIDRKDPQRHAALAHELAHGRLEHSIPGDAGEAIEQETSAWDSALSRGLEVSREYVEKHLDTYLEAIRKYYPRYYISYKEEIEQMLDRYYGDSDENI